MSKGKAKRGYVGFMDTPSEHRISYFKNSIHEDITNLNEKDPDYKLVREEIKWDDGGIFGCCSGDVGIVKGTFNIFYASVPCFYAISDARTSVYTVKNMEASLAESTQDIDDASTTGSVDNAKSLGEIVTTLQEHFDEKKNANFYATCCYPCTIDWVLRTTKNLKKLIKMVEKRRSERKDANGTTTALMMSRFAWYIQ